MALVFDLQYDLQRLLPHRPPFLLIDRILAVDLQEGSLRAQRTLSATDPLLVRGRLLAPTLLPTLLIEALCQAAACLNGLALPPAAPGQSHQGRLVGLSGFTFTQTAPAGPGDVLELRVQREGGLGAMVAIRGEAWRAPGELLCSGRLLLALVTS